MRVMVVASGSKGNATYVELGSKKILIDMGISYKQLRLKLEKNNVDITQLDYVFVTHEHTDHVSGLKTFCNNLHPTFYLSDGTYSRMNYEVKMAMKQTKMEFVKANDEIDLGDFKVKIIGTHHDAGEPIGFIFYENEKKFVYITDTGYVDEACFPSISNADIYVLESNHDPEVLWSSSRPFELKKRVAGDFGHLCNEDSAVIFSKVCGPRTKYCIHAHISEECNDFGLVTLTYKKVLETYGIDTSNIEFIHALQYDVTGDYRL